MAIISITCVKLMQRDGGIWLSTFSIVAIEKNIFLVLAMEQINDERKTITKV